MGSEWAARVLAHCFLLGLKFKYVKHVNSYSSGEQNHHGMISSIVGTSHSSKEAVNSFVERPFLIVLSYAIKPTPPSFSTPEYEGETDCS